MCSGLADRAPRLDISLAPALQPASLQSLRFSKAQRSSARSQKLEVMRNFPNDEAIALSRVAKVSRKSNIFSEMFCERVTNYQYENWICAGFNSRPES